MTIPDQDATVETLILTIMWKILSNYYVLKFFVKKPQPKIFSFQIQKYSVFKLIKLICNSNLNRKNF